MKKQKSIIFNGKTYTRNEYAIVCRLRNCDLCVRPHTARYDANCYHGHWANVCSQHFRSMNGKLGLGLGQILITHTEYKEITS